MVGHAALRAQAPGLVQDQQSHRETFIPTAEFTGHLLWAWPPARPGGFRTGLQAGMGFLLLRRGNAAPSGPGTRPWGREGRAGLGSVGGCVLPNLETGAGCGGGGAGWPRPQGDSPGTSPIVRPDPRPAPKGQQPDLFLFAEVSAWHLTQGWAPSWLPKCPSSSSHSQCTGMLAFLSPPNPPSWQ